MRRALDADTHSLTLHLAGTFSPTESHWHEGEHAAQLTVRLLARTRDASDLCPDFEVGDISLVFEQLAAIDVGDAERLNQLRHRYLALFLIALRDVSSPLPGPAPTWAEIRNRWAVSYGMRIITRGFLGVVPLPVRCGFWADPYR